MIASYPARVVVVRLESSQPKQLTFTAALADNAAEVRQKRNKRRTNAGSDGQYAQDFAGANGRPKNPLKFATHLRVTETDGVLSEVDGKLMVKDASAATLVLSAATSFVNFRDISTDPVVRSLADLNAATPPTYAELAAKHTADHQELYRRLAIDLGAGPDSNRKSHFSMPSSRMIRRSPRCFFQYGRYLMIASSRPGGQPANLQGIWNDELKPPWESKYTVNINAEMNYWPAEPCNLAECGRAAVRRDRATSPNPGRETAREHYDAPGWVLHHNFDLWRGTAPINASNHGIWPTRRRVALPASVVALSLHRRREHSCATPPTRS